MGQKRFFWHEKVTRALFAVVSRHKIVHSILYHKIYDENNEEVLGGPRRTDPNKLQVDDKDLIGEEICSPGINMLCTTVGTRNSWKCWCARLGRAVGVCHSELRCDVQKKKVRRQHG